MRTQHFARTQSTRRANSKLPRANRSVKKRNIVAMGLFGPAHRARMHPRPQARRRRARLSKTQAGPRLGRGPRMKPMAWGPAHGSTLHSQPPALRPPWASAPLFSFSFSLFFFFLVCGSGLISLFCWLRAHYLLPQVAIVELRAAELGAGARGAAAVAPQARARVRRRRHAAATARCGRAASGAPNLDQSGRRRKKKRKMNRLSTQTHERRITKKKKGGGQRRV